MEYTDSELKLGNVEASRACVERFRDVARWKWSLNVECRLGAAGIVEASRACVEGRICCTLAVRCDVEGRAVLKYAKRTISSTFYFRTDR